MSKAEIISITTRRPITEAEAAAIPALNQAPPRADAMSFLRMLASNAAAGAVDPQVVAHPDHELLGLCDQIVMLRKQEAEATDRWRDADCDSKESANSYRDMKRAQRDLRRPLLRAGKLPATTAAGIYAKAVAVRSAGITGVMLGKSLAADLLACRDLRAVLWPGGAA